MGNKESQLAFANKAADEEAGRSRGSGSLELERLEAARELCTRLNFLGARMIAEFEKSSDAGEGTANIFISPVSIATALAMVACGSTSGSDVERELTAFLGVRDVCDVFEKFGALRSALTERKCRGTQFLEGNSIWCSGAVGEEYKQAMGARFFALVEKLTTLEAINAYVADATKGAIPKILTEFPSGVRAVIVNAVYFKGLWVYQFDKSATQRMPFYGEDPQNERQVWMMCQKFKAGVLVHQEDVPLGAVVQQGEDPTHEMYGDVLVLPYEDVEILSSASAEAVPSAYSHEDSPSVKPKGKGPPRPEPTGSGKAGKGMPQGSAGLKSEFRAVFMLPSTYSQTDDHVGDVNRLFDCVCRDLQPGCGSDLQENLLQGKKSKYNTTMENLSELVLLLPRFRVEFGTEKLNKTLQNLGVTKSFTDDTGFQRMTPGAATFIEDVYHKAFAEVDEDGTVAAAATAVVMGKGKPAAQKFFRVDRPFLFAIQHVETGAFLFLGKIVDVPAAA